MAKLTAQAVEAWLQLKTPDANLASVIAATEAYVDSLGLPTETDGSWTPTTELGARMYAARLWRRRNSPNGVEAIGNDGGSAYVSRYDSDISRLLRLDRPRVG